MSFLVLLADCELTIARIHGGNSDGDTVRIDAKQGAKLVARIEMPLRDFAAATMGECIKARVATK